LIFKGPKIPPGFKFFKGIQEVVNGAFAINWLYALIIGVFTR